MDRSLTLFNDTLEFANPEYLMVLPIAALILVFGLMIFGLRLSLQPQRTHGSSYPWLGHIKFWFMLIVTLGAGLCRGGPALLGVWGVELQAWATSTSRWPSTAPPRCG